MTARQKEESDLMEGEIKKLDTMINEMYQVGLKAAEQEQKALNNLQKKEQKAGNLNKTASIYSLKGIGLKDDFMRPSATFLRIQRPDVLHSNNKGYRNENMQKTASIGDKQIATIIYKKPHEIPFYDSRFDIFYGNHREYTSQMNNEDEMIGLWSTEYNDGD